MYRNYKTMFALFLSRSLPPSISLPLTISFSISYSHTSSLTIDEADIIESFQLWSSFSAILFLIHLFLIHFLFLIPYSFTVREWCIYGNVGQSVFALCFFFFLKTVNCNVRKLKEALTAISCNYCCSTTVPNVFR